MTSKKDALKKSGWYTLACAAGLFSMGQSMAHSGQSAWFPTSTVAFPVQEAVLSHYLAPTETVEITVSMKLRNRDQLDTLTSSILTPGNPAYGQWLTSDQFLSNYGPLQLDIDAVVAYLKLSGFTGVNVSTNRLLVTAIGTPNAIRTAFNTELAHFTRNGKDGIANLSDVVVPASLSNSVLAVLGLQTLEMAKPLSIAAPAVAPSGNMTGHYPTEFPAIYSASSLPNASGTAVGIITEGNMNPVLTDLLNYDSQRGLPALHPTVVTVGTAGTDTTNTNEWDLDSQTIQSMAGGTVGSMTLYAAHSFSNADLTSAYNAALSGGATVINVSLGGCETAFKNDGSMATDDQIFQSAVSQGITFVVSSGDSGSKECGTQGPGNPGTIAGASYPASSPYVIAVGGTTLYTTNGVYSGESAWTYSGGEPSLYEAQPSYQYQITPNGARAVADISFDGDPATGAIIVVGSNNAYQVGGTSLSAPIFTGGWARIHSGFPGPAIYSHGSVPSSSLFNDVTTGNGNNGDYFTTSGWDYPTGFGSMNFAGFANVPIAPAAPNLAVSSEYCLSRADLSWNAISGATSYGVYRSFSQNNGPILPYSKLATTTSPSYFDNNSGKKGNVYYYKVNACNTGAGCGAYSNVAGAVQYTMPCQ